ncbi:MAG: hypothetical protein ACI4PH_07940 [Faecousia sp.]
MAIPRYFAMTAAEIRSCSALPSGIAWMACHFSPYGTGLSNLPRELPGGSLLILNDRTPIHGHDPQRIAEQLSEAIDNNSCCGVLLDFQRPDAPETAGLVKHLTQTLSCPTAVSELYAEGLTCPVFLPPVPPDVRIRAYLSHWEGREVWLEMALEGEIITLTKDGAAVAPLPFREAPEGGFSEPELHCHYQVQVSDTQALFSLWRTKDDLEDLLREAEELGIKKTVGLYQELLWKEK